MNSLIEVKAVEVGHDSVNAVSARDLWKAVGSKRRFSDWVKKRLEESDALQGIDFSVAQKNVVGKSNTYGQDKIDYLLSLEVATHIALLERNEAGKRMRRHLLGVQNSYLKSLEQKQNGLKLLPNQTQQAKDSETLGTVSRRQHSALMDLVGHGIATYKVEDRPCWFYKLTDHGKYLGYTTNKNGTILPPIG